jgi:Calcineurin-like phosphoesterase
MNISISKQMKWRIAGGAFLCLSFWAALSVAQQSPQDVDAQTEVDSLTQVLGHPTDHSIGLNVLAPNDLEAYAEYGVAPGKYTGKTATMKSKARSPFEIGFDKLNPNTRYYYRLQYRENGTGAYKPAAEYSFQTQRAPGSTFTFAVQADSHPERKNMFEASLYAATMAEVAKEKPDFYVTLGDDFSIDQLNKTVTPQVVSQVYINQRKYLGMGGSSTPIFLVAGGHEQGGRYLLDGTPNNPAVWVGNARNRYYALPAPDGFYTGDTEDVQFIGKLRDFYAWTWGDALFITLDPYWHSKIPVDTVMPGTGGGIGKEPGGGKKGADGKKGGAAGGDRQARDMWDITHGEEQYRWLVKTLSESKAKYKFMFAHHVLGTNRGAVEMADQFEWGGRNMRGEWEFDKKRPGWDMPIHQLMVKYGVSIFFQGHDHIFVRQEKDGVVYQETPNPGNPFYEDANGGWRSAYKSGDYLPASGHLRVTVGPSGAKVDYIRSWMPKDETPEHKQGEVAYSYTVKPGKAAQ